MATTANTQRGTTSLRGNHPAGRALGATAARPAADELSYAAARPLRLVRDAAGSAPAEEQLARVLPFPVRAAAPGPQRGVVDAPVPVRLTRRGRRVVAGLVLVGGLGFAALVGPALLGDPSPGPGLALAGESSVVVQPGDTLWSIAGDLAPDEDPRGVVDALQAANGLEGAELVPGQVLLVP